MVRQVKRGADIMRYSFFQGDGNEAEVRTTESMPRLRALPDVAGALTCRLCIDMRSSPAWSSRAVSSSHVTKLISFES